MVADLFGRENTTKQEKKLLIHIAKQLEELNKRVSALEQQQSEEKDHTHTSHEEIHDQEEPDTTANKASEKTLSHNDSNTRNHRVESVQHTQHHIPPASRETALKALQHDTIKEVSTNRKEIIKQKIVEQAREKRITAIELKTLFVDQKKYCSKASLYRYLKELAEAGTISYISINGKNHIYVLEKEMNNR